jgi:histidine triad (HIT) family protein
MAGCVFCDIIAGVVPGFNVYEDATTVAFLDRAPLMAGHVLVVPRTHYETLGDLPQDQIGPYFETVQLLATAVELAMAADGSFVAINIRISQSVPHLHTHIVPRKKGDGLFGKTFQWIRRPYPNEGAARAAQQAIRARLRPAT